MEWRERDGVRWLAAELPGAEVAFTTRHGGISADPYDTLNLGLLTEDEPAAVAENRQRLGAALGLPAERVAIGHQVHEAAVIEHRGPQDPSPWAAADRAITAPQADGHRTAAPGLALLVFVADCLPIAVSVPAAGEVGSGGEVAMLHGGWRPLAAGIVGAGTAGMNTAEAGAAYAAIGPGIGPCCFEVGEEVHAAFAGLGAGISDGRMLDLPEVAQRLLEREGVEVTERSGLCTRCHPELFFSHRGQGPATGRQAGLVWKRHRGEG